MALGGVPSRRALILLAAVLAVVPVTGDLSAGPSAPGDTVGLEGSESPEGPELDPAGPQAHPTCGGTLRHGAADTATSTPLGAPSWEACDAAIRPGAQMTYPYLCTFNFLFTDGDALYIGTAGHCTDEEEQRISAAGVGSFGTVVYRIDEGGPDDFALIEIDADKAAQAEPTVCGLGGPTGTNDGHYPSGATVYEYGWGFATGVHPASRERVHTVLQNSTEFPSWNGAGSGGDSGAPLLTATGEAYAVHTTGITPVAGVALEGGPHIQHVLELTRQAGYELEVIQGAPFQGL